MTGLHDVVRRPTPVAHSQARPPATAPTLVTGPPGSGRSTRALELATSEPVVVLSSTSATMNPTAWVRDLSTAMTHGQVQRRVASVVVDGIDLLPEPLLDLVVSHVRTPGRPELVLTSGPVATLAGRAATLAGTATRREETLPLSARREELPQIAARMMEQLEPDAHVRLLPQTVAVLRARSWPGNLHELWAVLDHALQRRWGDAIGVKDLPDGYRAEVPDHTIPPLDRAQRDVIVATLRRHDGNKVKVAADLGLSRTTLYARMKALRITTY